MRAWMRPADCSRADTPFCHRAVARLGPTILNKTIGIVAPELRHYIAYVKAVKFFAGMAGWALSGSLAIRPVSCRHRSSTTVALRTVFSTVIST